MPVLDCLDDALTVELNRRGYQPIMMPNTRFMAPDVWVYDNDKPQFYGALSFFVPKESLTTTLDDGEIPDLASTHTSRKGARIGLGFLKDALRCIGVDSAPKLDLSFAGNRDVTFNFTGVTTRGVAPAALFAAIENFNPRAIPAEQVAAGMVHIAYEYAYAKTLNIHFGTGADGKFDLTAIKIDGMIDVGGKAEVKKADATTLSFIAKSAPAAFAFKIGPLTRRRKKWEFRVTENSGQGATPDEAAAAEPYLLRRGAVLVGGEDRS